MPLKLNQIVDLPEKRESNEDMVGFNAIINSISNLEVKKEKVLELMGMEELDKMKLGEFLASFATRACQIPADNWTYFICDTTEQFCAKFLVPVGKEKV